MFYIDLHPRAAVPLSIVLTGYISPVYQLRTPLRYPMLYTWVYFFLPLIALNPLIFWPRIGTDLFCHRHRGRQAASLGSLKSSIDWAGALRRGDGMGGYRVRIC